MNMCEHSSPTGTVAVSSGAGQACQYRVQYQSPRGVWRRYATFRQPTLAQSCLRQLCGRGLRARIVHFAIVPFAG